MGQEVNEKEYQIDYVLKNPPTYAKKYKTIWQQAVRDYFERQGVDIKKISKIDNVEWNEVIRIFNTLLGVKNRKRPEGFKKMKNDKLVAEDILEGLSLIEGLGELKASNSYYKVVKPFKLWAKTGSKASNYHYGASQLYEPIFKEFTAAVGSEIHNLHGGTFFVSIEGDEVSVFPATTEKKEFSPFEKSYGGSREPRWEMSNLEEIPSKSAIKVKSYTDEPKADSSQTQGKISKEELEAAGWFIALMYNLDMRESEKKKLMSIAPNWSKMKTELEKTLSKHTTPKAYDNVMVDVKSWIKNLTSNSGGEQDLWIETKSSYSK